ncbi:hypothetical protein B0H14DRAFT_3475988 [Mycena olivaceomarginata]|nr:hypothetical protein B0H14DRAFT_3475988 [Mycena olivaceomarginata]
MAQLLAYQRAGVLFPSCLHRLQYLFRCSPVRAFCANCFPNASVHSGPSFSPSSASSDRREDTVRTTFLHNFMFEYRPMRALRCYKTLGLYTLDRLHLWLLYALTLPYLARSFASGRLPRVIFTLPEQQLVRCFNIGVLRLDMASRPSDAVHFCTSPGPPFPPPARRLYLPAPLNTLFYFSHSRRSFLEPPPVPLSPAARLQRRPLASRSPPPLPSRCACSFTNTIGLCRITRTTVAAAASCPHLMLPAPASTFTWLHVPLPPPSRY